MTKQRSDFARAVRELRYHCGLTQLKFALALDVTPVTVSRWETQDRAPDGYCVYRLWKFADLNKCKAQAEVFERFLAARRRAEVGLSA